MGGDKGDEKEGNTEGEKEGAGTKDEPWRPQTMQEGAWEGRGANGANRANWANQGPCDWPRWGSLSLRSGGAFTYIVSAAF